MFLSVAGKAQAQAFPLSTAGGEPGTGHEGDTDGNTVLAASPKEPRGTLDPAQPQSGRQDLGEGAGGYFTGLAVDQKPGQLGSEAEGSLLAAIL